MFNNVALDVCIGLIFIFLLYSLLATTIQEIWSQITARRSKVLYKSIKYMLHDSDLVTAFYGHPLIKSLARSSATKYPSYIAADTFSRTMIQLLRGGSFDQTTPQIELIRRSLFAFAGNELVVGSQKYKMSQDTIDYLRMIWVDCANDIDKFRTMLEQWYNNSMDRASGSYKRKSQVTSIIIGFALAGVFNIDTIAITKILSSNPTVSNQLASFAIEKYKALDPGARSSAHVTDSLLLSVASAAGSNAQLSKLVLGLGYGDKLPDQDKYQHMANLLFLLGWLITALAISLGAPFWFDLLSKLIQLRGTGPKPVSQTSDGSTTLTGNDTPSSPTNRKG